MTKSIQSAVGRFLRGPLVARALGRAGISSRQYWVLVDLYSELSERGEVLDELGRNGVALKTAGWLYAFISAVFTLPIFASHPSVNRYFWLSSSLGSFLLFTLLLSEGANSLFNAAEGPVLGHQPLNGATYVAAKLTHLGAIVLYLAPALNLIPALAGLLLKDSRWTYPIVHMIGALVLGLCAALLCCAFYGWLVHFVPASRLKTVGLFAATIPMIFVAVPAPAYAAIRQSSVWHWMIMHCSIIAAPAVLFGFATVIFGLRSLSADSLTRFSFVGISKSSRRNPRHRLSSGSLIASWFGGPSARAGFAFTWRMMLRDWQFRRQLAPMFILVPLTVGPIFINWWRVDPFAGRFTAMHFLPHLCGMMLFFLCNFMPYGADYKGGSMFLLAPSGAFEGFTRGVWAALWLRLVALPHLVLLSLLAWRWGVPHGLLFTSYDAAVVSTYLALGIRRVDGAPFSRQVDPSSGAALLPLMFLGGLGAVVVVGVQYGLLFRSSVAVAAATVTLAPLAVLLTRQSLKVFEISIRYQLAQLANDPGTRLYREVGV